MEDYSDNDNSCLGLVKSTQDEAKTKFLQGNEESKNIERKFNSSQDNNGIPFSTKSTPASKNGRED